MMEVVVRHALRYVANCSMLFAERPLLERPAAAAAAGFDAVEFWWPFPTATPPDREVDGFVAAVEDAGVALTALNFPAGDMPAGDRGLVSWPGCEAEFRAGVEVAVGIGGRLGTAGFNALYGNRIDGTDPREQDELAVENLAFAAAATRRIGAVALVEPVSGAPRYPLRTADEVVAVLDRVGAENTALLADLYHLSMNGDDLDDALARHHARIAHVQIADAPGRHEPGTGQLDLDRHLRALERAGYTGRVGLEYAPDGTTESGLGWLPRERRSSSARTA